MTTAGTNVASLEPLHPELIQVMSEVALLAAHPKTVAGFQSTELADQFGTAPTDPLEIAFHEPPYVRPEVGRSQEEFEPPPKPEHSNIYVFDKAKSTSKTLKQVVSENWLETKTSLEQQASLGAYIVTQTVDQTIHRAKVKSAAFKKAFIEDWRASEHKSKMVASWLGYAATKTIGRFQLPAMGVAYASMEVLANTRSVALTILTAVTTSTLWSRVAAGAVNNTINNHPLTFKAAGDSFPKASQTVAETLPGLRAYTPEGLAAKNKQSIWQRVGARAMRGLVAVNKLTPYLSAAGREGQTVTERSQLARGLSIDAGIVRGVMYGTIAKTILTVSQHNPALAERIQSGVKSPLLWGALGGLMMAGEFAKNKWTKRRNNDPDPSNLVVGPWPEGSQPAIVETAAA